MTVSKSQPKAATKRPIVPLRGGNSMNAKKGYSSHSPNSPLRGYEGGDRGTERNYFGQNFETTVVLTNSTK